MNTSPYSSTARARTAFPGFAATDSKSAVFGHTMGLVALTTAMSAFGMWLGRDLSPGPALLYWLASLVCALFLRAAMNRSNQLAIGVLFALGATLGAALGPTIAHYAKYQPTALWESGATTALAVAALGSFGYATRRDLSFLARGLFFSLLGLIAFGIIVILTQMPHGMVIYCVLGLVIFCLYTVYDFNRLARSRSVLEAPLLAANIFLDILNLFMLLLRLFGGSGSGSRR